MTYHSSLKKKKCSTLPSFIMLHHTFIFGVFLWCSMMGIICKIAQLCLFTKLLQKAASSKQNTDVRKFCPIFLCHGLSIWWPYTTAICIHVNVNCMCTTLWIANHNKCYGLLALWMDLYETGTNHFQCKGTHSWLFQGLQHTKEIMPNTCKGFQLCKPNDECNILLNYHPGDYRQ